MTKERLIFEGEQALEGLSEAKKLLNGARNWGYLDIYGGKGFCGVMKHYKFIRAKLILEDAQRHLKNFQEELHFIPNVDININVFFSLADFFVDGVFSDLLVQSRIEVARERLDDAISEIEFALYKLQSD